MFAGFLGRGKKKKHSVAHSIAKIWPSFWFFRIVGCVVAFIPVNEIGISDQGTKLVFEFLMKLFPFQKAFWRIMFKLYVFEFNNINKL